MYNNKFHNISFNNDLEIIIKLNLQSLLKLLSLVVIYTAFMGCIFDNFVNIIIINNYFYLYFCQFVVVNSSFEQIRSLIAQ
jgi:hypothetical protein